ncbi:DUF4190 domain-containing protein [Patescibacteria group bacterium]|nr:DUF4190 domain-containing protein [Patescibacteria group bacterium]
MEEEKQISPQPQKKNKWALASLICGVLSIFSMFGIFGIFPFLAIAFGTMGLIKKENKTFSIIGITLGILALIFKSFLFFLSWLWK